MNGRARRLFTRLPEASPGWRAYAVAAAVVGAVAVLGALLLGHLDLANIVMLFPLAVLFAAVRLGRGPAVLAAFLSVALFDFFFVHPHFTLVVSDLQYLLTFAVLLAVALITAELAARLRLQRDAAERREERTHALYEMARELSAALTAEQIAEIAERYVRESCGAHARVLVPDDHGRLRAVSATETEAAVPADGNAVDEGRWARADAESSAASAPLQFPLLAPMRNRGVLAVTPLGQSAPLSDEHLRLLETFAPLVAIALERVHYIAVAQEAQVSMASERLRNRLLGALSHDLRTPLTVLAGLSDTLALSAPPLPAAQAELAQAIREEALRTSTLVHNLLDMARLRSGHVRLRREWQPLEEVVGAALQARARQLDGHALRLDLPADLPLVNIDAVLMERVFCNLLENAAKYTPAGSTIEIAARPLAENIEIVVADNGPGLPAGREAELFGQFSRGQIESSIPGVGLGLSIVQAIVEAHGGTVRAERKAAGGARFVLELPRGEPPCIPMENA